ncbi:MAG: TlpA disulfide reductase family protein [Chloroflexi bacterium]|nr:TlpA disulfide reductase family protein [Chloroflexota bacterium]
MAAKKKESRKRKLEKSARPKRPNSGIPPLYMWIGGGVLVAVIVAIAILASINTTGGPVNGVDGAAPDFHFSVYEGADILGADEMDFSQLFTSGKPVVLNFWAGLCPPCRAEMPAFQAVYDELQDDFVLIGIDIGPYVGLGSRQDALDFIQEFGITYPTGTTDQSRVVPNYRVLSMPTTFFLLPDGTVVNSSSGGMSETRFRNEVAALIAASSS